jgi:hypothetical protein
VTYIPTALRRDVIERAGDSSPTVSEANAGLRQI